jgi:alpha-L-rhamnosidase
VIDDKQWTAQWVEPQEDSLDRKIHRPAYHLVGTFAAAAPQRATLFITAHGLYEAFVNGARVGDDELTPGFSAYRSRLKVQTYDVTSLVRAGENAWGVLLSDGWWRGQANIARFTNSFGDTVAVLAELHVTDDAGITTVFATDGSWRSTPSHILRADLIAGEVHDLRSRVDGWAEPSTDRSAWDPVRVVDHDFSRLVADVAPPVRRIRELPALSVTEVRPGRHIVDFGQTSNGWIRLTDLGPTGTTLEILSGEHLVPSGDEVDVAAVAGAAFAKEGADRVPFQTDVVTSVGDGSVFEPRHSTKGFQYVRIDGHPGPLAAESITSVVVGNDVAAIGGFSCSNDDLNWLHRAADWSLRTNLCSIPTDCPTRERAGWTGDWQIYVGTASYLYDVTDFSREWLHDVAADQLDSGAITHFSPDSVNFDNPRAEWWKELQGSAGWGDAIVHVPWELYLTTGRVDVLEPFVEPMRRWVEFAANLAATGRHPDRAAARPKPAPHETFLWDTGFHFGEWNEPMEQADQLDRVRVMDHGPTATAFLYRSADELSRIGELVGDADLAARYRDLAARALEAWRLEFIDEAGAVSPVTQANLVRALAFGLIPESFREQAVAQLVGLIREADTHLFTGFLATPFLLPVLADNGALDVAYELLFQRTPPSWLAMRDAGASTIWENWQPFSSAGLVECSLNHFSMGAVISFLHRYVAGLQMVEPGYRRFKVEPRIGGGITRASTYHDSAFGRIAVEWSLDGGLGAVTVAVPAGTEAELVLPNQAPEWLRAGEHRRVWNEAGR